CLLTQHHDDEPKPKGTTKAATIGTLVFKGSMSLMNTDSWATRDASKEGMTAMHMIKEGTEGIRGSKAGQSVIQSPSMTPGFKRHGRFRHLPFGSSYEVPLGSYVNGNLAATSVPTTKLLHTIRPSMLVLYPPVI
ncbi:hypothetical protein NEUTE1DRAFT_36875, partial [Neurospora tetrasperma FGSC 2508]